MLCAALAFVLTAQSSQAMTFSFPGSGSSANNSFSFVAPAIPQAAQYHFGNIIPQSFKNIIPPTMSGQYVFGAGSTGSSYTYGSGSPYAYGIGSTSGSGYTYGTGSTGSTSGGYTYGAGSTSGSSGYTYGTGSTSGSGSSYIYGGGSSSSSGSGSSGSDATTPSDDNADGPNDAMMVAQGTADAATVSLMLNGQQVSPNALPSFLNGANPFSYRLIKGKPGGAIVKLPSAKKTYAYTTATNAYTLQACNATKKPFNWSIQVDPNSIPQNLVMMSAPQASGGQTCAAGATGACKKPTSMCYYGDSYTSQPVLSGTYGSAVGSVSGWTVNMCLRWAYLSPMLVQATANGLPNGWLYNLPTGGVLTATANFNKTLPLSQSSVTVSIPTTSPPVFFNPGMFNLRYNGVTGAIPGVGGSWSLAGMQLLNWDSSVVGQCLGQDCVTTGVSYNALCADVPSGGWYLMNAHPFALVVYFYNNTQSSRPTRLPAVAPKGSYQTYPAY